MIVLSDGGDNASARPLPQVLRAAEQSDAIVYTVGLFDLYDADRNPGVLKQLARMSGGEAFFPQDIAAVTGVLQRVSREIRNQYTIGYTPSNPARIGTFRTIQVKLTPPHSNRWSARTRTGYIAEPAQP